jgi:16S rRNA (guanine527-N7)-methyltransferase
VSDVSRETDSLKEHFSDVPGLRQYAAILADRGVELGLLGPREVPRIWPRHLANCAVVASEERAVIPPGAHVADVGSGAGLPGVVWALVRPDLRLTLVEPLLRRATFLTDVVAELGLSPRVDVARSRAEDLVGTYDVVTARAVARMPQLLQWTFPLVRPGGWLVALKGASARAEIAEARPVLTRLSAGRVEVRSYGVQVLLEPTTAVLVQRPL